MMNTRSHAHKIFRSRFGAFKSRITRLRRSYKNIAPPFFVRSSHLVEPRGKVLRCSRVRESGGNSDLGKCAELCSREKKGRGGSRNADFSEQQNKQVLSADPQRREKCPNRSNRPENATK